MSLMIRAREVAGREAERAEALAGDAYSGAYTVDLR